jgi:CarD family transcriptional regulator, regulator of rRNA transcription
MRYRVGDTVFCPPHGRAHVEAVEARRVNGEDRTYLVLRATEHADLVLRVPVQHLDQRGVDAMPQREELEQVLAILRSKNTEPPTKPWAQQCRHNAQALASGDVLEAARVLRDVWQRGCAQPLTRSDKRMLARAREALVTRLSLCLEETTSTQVEQLIEDALASSWGHR